MRGIYALTLVVFSIFVLLTLATPYFSIDRMNGSFLDYRNALYQSYLAHDVEYSLHETISSLRSKCLSLLSVGEGDKCQILANEVFSSLVAAWAMNGVAISGGGLSVVPTASGVDVRLSTDLHWQKGDYSGIISAGYGG